MNKLLELLVKHNMKITMIAIFLPMLLQIKHVIFAPVISLYEKLPSYHRIYDATLSMRNPFYEPKIDHNQEIINNITKKYKEKDYGENANTNLKFIVRELLNLDEDDGMATPINLALVDLENFKYARTKQIFKNQSVKADDTKAKVKYLGLIAMTNYFSNKNLAIKNYNEALRLDPNHLFILNNLGKLYLEVKSYQNADTVFKRMVKFGKENKKPSITASAYSNLGIIHLRQEDYTTALRNFNKALKIAKKYDYKITMANLYINIAVSYEKQDKIPKACANYRRARIIYYKNYKDELADNMLGRLKQIECL